MFFALTSRGKSGYTLRTLITALEERKEGKRGREEGRRRGRKEEREDRRREKGREQVESIRDVTMGMRAHEMLFEAD